MNQYFNLRPNEKTIRTLRRHKIFFLRGIFQLLGILLLTVILILGLDYLAALKAWMSLIIILIVIILVVLLVVYWWYLWKNDLYVLTDQRLIDIDQNGLFNRVVNEMPLDKIQDVTYEVIGPLPTIFHFGKVIIKTAGPQEDTVIETIANPQQITQEISIAFKIYREQKGLIKKGSSV